MVHQQRGLYECLPKKFSLIKKVRFSIALSVNEIYYKFDEIKFSLALKECIARNM